MDYGSSADYGKCSKEPHWFASSVFMLLPFFCNCLHSLFSMVRYYTINLRSCVACRDPFWISRLVGLERRDEVIAPYHGLRGSGHWNVICKVQAPLRDSPFYILHSSGPAAGLCCTHRCRFNRLLSRSFHLQFHDLKVLLGPCHCRRFKPSCRRFCAGSRFAHRLTDVHVLFSPLGVIT